jgi:methionyl aminopeptidase
LSKSKNQYNEQELEDLRKAGKLLARIFKKLLPQITPGKKVADIVDSIELLIIKSGAELSFPPNISVNTIAAHDTAGVFESRTIPDNSLVKVDFGVAINQCLTDCARTLAFGEVPVKLIEASKAALDKAISMAKPGVKVGNIGDEINKTIESYGFKPIRNLTGHQIAKGTLHAGVSIPNIKATGIVGNKKLQEGCTYAIEPFATNGKTGVVEDKPKSYPLIFSMNGKPKSSLGKKIYEKVKNKPFSARWASRLIQDRTDSASMMNKILKAGHKDGWHSYPPLIEVSNGMVGQSEDMILITKDGAEIITLGAYE